MPVLTVNVIALKYDCGDNISYHQAQHFTRKHLCCQEIWLLTENQYWKASIWLSASVLQWFCWNCSPPWCSVECILTSYWPWSELWLVGYRHIKLKVYRDNTAGILERLIWNYNVIKALLTYYLSSFKCWIVFVVGCELIRVVGVPICYWTWGSYRWYIFMVDKCLRVVSTRNINIACTTCFSNRQVSIHK